MAKSDASGSAEAARTARRSRLMTAVATIGFAAIIGSCCLCGGAVYVRWPSFETDRQAAIDVTGQILPVTVPEVFTPEGAIRWDLWMFLKMQGAYYTLSTGEGELSFLEVDSRFIDNPEFRAHILKSLREHGAGGGFDLAVHSAEAREYEIDGQSVSFNFLSAEDRTTGNDRRLVDGVVDGTHGPVMISLWVEEDQWDPELVDRLIASIGQPE